LFVPQYLSLRPAGSTDYLSALIIFSFLSFMIWKGEGRFALSCAFALGFVLGLVSDLESTRLIHGVVFGGDGLFDGDFFEPIAMLVATWTVRRALKE
jgi:hypothetical protein